MPEAAAPCRAHVSGALQAADWDGFAAVSDELIDGGDTIVSLGHYSGTNKATGKKMRAQFAHVFRVRSGKITSFQQYADTLGTAIAMGR